MLQSSESETEILLGNKQLLGVFFVVVLLLGVAFAGGYKIGQANGKKAAAPAASPATASEEATGSSPASSTSTTSTASSTAQGGETHAFPANGSASEQPEAPRSHTADTGTYHPPSGEDEAPPLGSSSRHAKGVRPAATPPAPVSEPASEASFTPISGQTFLQVVAAGRDESQAIADVLRKKGFRAHAVPKPGSTKLYRVLIGPMRDSGDLAATRDALRKTGFREIFIQRY